MTAPGELGGRRFVPILCIKALIVGQAGGRFELPAGPQWMPSKPTLVLTRSTA